MIVLAPRHCLPGKSRSESWRKLSKNKAVCLSSTSPPPAPSLQNQATGAGVQAPRGWSGDGCPFAAKQGREMHVFVSLTTTIAYFSDLVDSIRFFWSVLLFPSQKQSPDGRWRPGRVSRQQRSGRGRDSAPAVLGCFRGLSSRPLPSRAKCIQGEVADILANMTLWSTTGQGPKRTAVSKRKRGRAAGLKCVTLYQWGTKYRTSVSSYSISIFLYLFWYMSYNVYNYIMYINISNPRLLLMIKPSCSHSRQQGERKEELHGPPMRTLPRNCTVHIWHLTGA